MLPTTIKRSTKVRHKHRTQVDDQLHYYNSSSLVQAESGTFCFENQYLYKLIMTTVPGLPSCI